MWGARTQVAAGVRRVFERLRDIGFESMPRYGAKVRGPAAANRIVDQPEHMHVYLRQYPAVYGNNHGTHNLSNTPPVRSG